MSLSYIYNLILFISKKNVLLHYFLKIISSYGSCLLTDVNEYLQIKKESVLIKFKKNNTNKSCIFFSWSTFSAIRFELGYVKAIELAGYNVIIVCSPEIPIIKFWRSLGIKNVYNINQLSLAPNYNEFNHNCNLVKNFDDIDKLKFCDVNFGRYISATIMRQFQIVNLDLTNQNFRKILNNFIFKSLSYVRGATKLYEKFKPDLVYVMDQNYTPRGEFFEFFINKNVKIITSNTAHVANHFILKKYSKLNKYEHPRGISNKNWSLAKREDWSDKRWNELKNELEKCYSTGSWFPSASTASYSKIESNFDLSSELNLDPNKKTAIIFSHIIWDATFFWGVDLFKNYEEWLIETIKIAVLNENVNWLIKIHPSNLVKANKNILQNRQFSELQAIEKRIGELPKHIKIIFPDTQISTYNLLNKVDYCITVRGTPGLECAAFGVTAITAGTGRYDSRGFTTDSSNIFEYKEKIKNIMNLEKMTDKQVLDARMFLYMTLFDKNFKLSFVDHNYFTSDNKVIERTKINLNKKKALSKYEEIISISKWLQDDEEDFFIKKYL